MEACENDGAITDCKERNVFDNDVFVTSLMDVCDIYCRGLLASCCKRFGIVKRYTERRNGTTLAKERLEAHKRKLYLFDLSGNENVVQIAAKSMMYAEAFSNNKYLEVLVVEAGQTSSWAPLIKMTLNIPVVEASVYIAKTVYSMCIMRWLVGWYNTLASERDRYIRTSAQATNIQIRDIVKELKNSWIYTTEPNKKNTFTDNMKTRYLNKEGVTVFTPKYVFEEIMEEVNRIS